MQTLSKQIMLTPKADGCDVAHYAIQNNEAHACIQKEDSCTTVSDGCRGTAPDIGTIIPDAKVAMDVACSSINIADRIQELDQSQHFPATDEMDNITGISLNLAPDALDDAGDVCKDNGLRTPTKKTIVPKVGMSFVDVESVENFYKMFTFPLPCPDTWLYIAFIC
ncbi:hypothetical protein U9M48_017594 [Paspalum notatum var. saurae]|uniref:Uncharacterized protein n=1 Tax=Paspalum notatum var. saurae TaxID=547442 RepID=A0AAQ3T7S4_PASNO